MRAANRVSFESEEWRKIGAWMREHQKEIETVGTPSSVCAALLRDGIKCNRRAIIEAAMYLHIRFIKTEKLRPRKVATVNEPEGPSLFGETSRGRNCVT